MGLILDSSVIIAGERRGHSVLQILEQIQAIQGETEMGLSVVTIVELLHGVERANDTQRRKRRQLFVDELAHDIPVHAVTIETAKIAGRILGERASQGVNVPFKDLLIAATALQLG